MTGRGNGITPVSNSEVITGLLEAQGATTEIIQEPDPGVGGYTVLMVSVPGVGDIEISVNE